MLNLVTDRLPEYVVFNKNIVFRMEFFTTVRDAGPPPCLSRGSGVGRTTLPPCARSCGRCKNLGTGCSWRCLTVNYLQLVQVHKSVFLRCELYQKSWTKSKSNGKEQQFTSAPAGAAVRFVRFGSEPCGKRAYPRRGRQHVEICIQVVPPGEFYRPVSTSCACRIPEAAERQLLRYQDSNLGRQNQNL